MMDKKMMSMSFIDKERLTSETTPAFAQVILTTHSSEMFFCRQWRTFGRGIFTRRLVLQGMTNDLYRIMIINNIIIISVT